MDSAAREEYLTHCQAERSLTVISPTYPMVTRFRNSTCIYRKETRKFRSSFSFMAVPSHAVTKGIKAQRHSFPMDTPLLLSIIG